MHLESSVRLRAFASGGTRGHLAEGVCAGLRCEGCSEMAGGIVFHATRRGVDFKS